MIDKEFEMWMEAAAELLTNEGYFARYRAHLADGKKCRAAWELTEAELPFGLRRYRNYTSFKDALFKERKGVLSASARLTYSTD